MTRLLLTQLMCAGQFSQYVNSDLFFNKQCLFAKGDELTCQLEMFNKTLFVVNFQYNPWR